MSSRKSTDLCIASVKVHQLEGSLGHRFGWSLGWTERRNATLVEVTTSDGLTGWGDGPAGEPILERSPERVVGRSAFEVQAIYDELRQPGGHQERRGPNTAGGLDTALWDVCGKALGVPVWRLLGERHRTEVEPYCTALYRKDWPDMAAGLAEEACGWVRTGFRSVKMKIGYGLDTDTRVVRAVREAIGPDVGLAVDSNCAYDAATAVSLGRRLEEFNLLWWEEPLLADDFDGYRRVRESMRIPVAAGETFDLDRLTRHYVQPDLVDILQPEVEVIGLTGAMRLSWLCWLNRIRLIPHNWGTCVRTAAILHWAATIPPITNGLYAPPVMFELDRTEHPFRDAIVHDPIRPSSEGLVPVPDGPGLGIEVNPDALECFRTDLREY